MNLNVFATLSPGRWRRKTDDLPANMLAIAEMLQALVVVVVVVNSKDSRMVVATKRSFFVAIDGLDGPTPLSFRGKAEHPRKVFQAEIVCMRS